MEGSKHPPTPLRPMRVNEASSGDTEGRRVVLECGGWWLQRISRTAGRWVTHARATCRTGTSTGWDGGYSRREEGRELHQHARDGV